ncbi:MAG: hypothetical protein C0483_12930 [Pirellula sp.]|nr:hypothetical protein [Pirellula sp.]
MVVRNYKLGMPSGVRRLGPALQVGGCCIALILAGCEQKPAEPVQSRQSSSAPALQFPAVAERANGPRAAPLAMPPAEAKPLESAAATFSQITPREHEAQHATLVGIRTKGGLTLATATSPSRAAPMPSAMAAQNGASLIRQAESLNMSGLRLVGRGAHFSARAEFLGALRAGAAAIDASGGAGSAESRVSAVDAALLALTEAEDFASSQVAGRNADLLLAVRSHRSGLLSADDVAQRTASQLHQVYCEFACEQLSGALATLPCGSVSLHGLGKVNAALGAQGQGAPMDARAKAEVFYTAALRVDADNFPAANDLAVLLAEDGRLEQARQVLRTGLAASPHPAMWNNLASIHDRLGEPQLAAAARWEAQSLATSGGKVGGRPIMPTHDVQWVPAQNFAATARPNVAAPMSSNAPNNSSASTLPAVRQSPAAPASPVDERLPIQTARQPQRNSLLN